jgi:hypothetical protein
MSRLNVGRGFSRATTGAPEGTPYTPVHESSLC